MAITRVKPGDWAFEDRLLRSEITQVDKNHSYALDSGSATSAPLDECESDNTFKTASVLGKDDHGSFTINDPTDISIQDGVDITIDSLIATLGRNGYTEIELESTSDTTLVSDGYVNSIIALTGNISNDVSVIFPAVSGYTKLIDCQYTMSGYDGYGFDGYGVTLSAVGSSEEISVYPGTRTIVYCDGTDLFEVVNEGSHYRLVDQIYMKTNPNPLNGPLPGAVQPKQLYPVYLGGFGVPSYVKTTTYPTIKLGKYGISDLNFNDLRVKGEAVFLDGRAGDKFEIFLQCGVQRTGGAANTVTFIAPFVSYGEGWFSSYYDNFLEPKNKIQEVIMAGAVTAEDGDFVQGSSTTIFEAPIDGCYQFDLYAYALLLTSFYQNPVIGFSPVIYRVKQYRK